VPLPPYIKQDDNLAEEYQTVYAKPLGSKAAPTAGLHFTNELLNKIKTNHDIAEVTLHVGLGTFSPLTDEQLKKDKLHSEYFEVDSKNFEVINSAKHATAVGTTSARTLESIYANNSLPKNGWTDILIKPGYKFKRTNSLITNFHLPDTSLLLLVEAIVGSEVELQHIYNHAIVSKYRFYSFGDAMLVI
jgi:S-adenosylmethionine:tRNA ribosyltransferase-isomerase